MAKEDSDKLAPTIGQLESLHELDPWTSSECSFSCSILFSDLMFLKACSQHSSRQGKPMTPYSSFCRRTLGKIWSTNILFQQRTKGKSSRSTTQFLFRRIPFFK
ncbi:uncharacterized protein [Aegilops tauschii subsp. strangulata]|uniref:Uncharacterized protein n=1 Tax=Aegilops tauschii subsp. strangulata TaxID=200361 RepID=A0A453PMI0_AEGTS